MSMMISSHAVSAQIEIGKGTTFFHHGLGCCILNETIIGENCKIFQNVTIGNSFGNTNKCKKGGATVGNNCMIGAGSVIIGSVHIGNNVSIGANAVVLEDIPDNAVAVGVPAVIKKYKMTEE